jgi:hypothetical protein
MGNAVLVNVIADNEDGNTATFCFNVTDGSLDSCFATSDATSDNTIVCFNVSGEPANTSEDQSASCTGDECLLTAQDLAFLVLASIINSNNGFSNSTNSSTAADSSVPFVRFPDLAANALTGDNLPVNMSLILSGVAGEAARDNLLELLNYTVSCALNYNQSVTLPLSSNSSSSDSENETAAVVLDGGLGLAPNWAERKITAAEQEAVSACLAARVNFFGAHLLISVRGAGLAPPEADEVEQYTLQEGAFWGNILSADGEGELFACSNRTNLLNSYASLRFCSTGFPVPDGSTISCGEMRHVGSCESWCLVNPDHPDEFTSCGRYRQILSVYLPPANPE